MANLTEKFYCTTFTLATTDYCNVYEMFDENISDYIPEDAKHIIWTHDDVDMLEFDTDTLSSADRECLMQLDNYKSDIPQKMMKSKLTIISNMSGINIRNCISDNIENGHIEEGDRWLLIDEFEEDEEVSLEDLKKEEPNFVEYWYELYPQDEFGE